MNSKIPVSATGRAFSFPRALAFSLALALGLSSLSSPAVFADTVSAGPGVSGPAAGGAAGGLYAGLLGVKAFQLVPVANFLALTAYVGGNTANVINGVISGVISIVVAAVVTYILCRGDSKKA